VSAESAPVPVAGTPPATQRRPQSGPAGTGDLPTITPAKSTTRGTTGSRIPIVTPTPGVLAAQSTPGRSAIAAGAQATDLPRVTGAPAVPVTQRRATGSVATPDTHAVTEGVTEESVRVPRDVQEAVAAVTGQRPQEVTDRRRFLRDRGGGPSPRDRPAHHGSVTQTPRARVDTRRPAALRHRTNARGVLRGSRRRTPGHARGIEFEFRFDLGLELAQCAARPPRCRHEPLRRCTRRAPRSAAVLLAGLARTRRVAASSERERCVARSAHGPRERVERTRVLGHRGSECTGGPSPSDRAADYRHATGAAECTRVPGATRPTPRIPAGAAARSSPTTPEQRGCRFRRTPGREQGGSAHLVGQCTLGPDGYGHRRRLVAAPRAGPLSAYPLHAAQ